MSNRPAQLRTVPVLPLREVVVFPGTPSPLIVGRARSVAAVTAAVRTVASPGPGGEILLLTQRKSDVTHVSPADLHEIGTLGEVVQVLKLPDGNTKLLVEGRQRARVVRFLPHDEHFEAEIELLEPSDLHDPEVEALSRSLKAAVERYVKLNRAAPPDMLMGLPVPAI